MTEAEKLRKYLLSLDYSERFEIGAEMGRERGWYHHTPEEGDDDYEEYVVWHECSRDESEGYVPPKSKYRGPRDTYLGAETRRRRKKRSALSATGFRSRMREKDPYQVGAGKADPWGLRERMGPVCPVVIVL